MLLVTPEDRAPDPSRTKAAICTAVDAILDNGRPVPTRLFATGGDTALAVLQAVGPEQVVLQAELRTGMPILALRTKGQSITMVTKAGGFGTDDALSAAINRQLVD